MDKRILAVIAIIAVVVIAAAALLLLNPGNGGDKDKTVDMDTRLYIYGNANNDDYLNNDDVSTLESIISSGSWNKAKNPYADANQDGKIDKSDVDVVKKFIKGEEARMYYLSSEWGVKYINFPLSKDKIAVTLDYGLVVCSILDIYDGVKGAETKLLAKGEIRYPGLHSMEDLGDQRKDATGFVERVLNKGYDVVMGRPYTDTYDLLRNSGQDCEHIMLNYTKDYGHRMDNISALLMTAYMFNIPEKGHEYCSHFDKIHDEINSKMVGLDKKSYVMTYANIPFDTDVTEVTVETEASSGGSFGTYWFASLLPMKNAAKPAANGEYKMLLEDLITANPDYIIVTLWGINDDDTPESAQAQFNEYAKILKNTRAYKEGHIFGVSYESIGTQLGIASSYLMASFLWPDMFDKETGYKQMQETYDKYSDLKSGTDVRNLGGLLIYKAETGTGS